ncbi:hypothetical protein PPTG_20057 [Phytophthora nicotianae INRA-310]|uniref:Uncharacterized protein n=2 Tax=Phytophthora nicotianae TaxID=4792 RepID=W2P9T2_PHYN3|nr:hypothetical protein PPTG_20057 [Phytophthora nicotianae INRA-310]ETM97772.1 hypothetical protein PPTG_20057 [Phytophthora nicotianae INRA-310]
MAAEASADEEASEDDTLESGALVKEDVEDKDEHDGETEGKFEGSV